MYRYRGSIRCPLITERIYSSRSFVLKLYDAPEAPIHTVLKSSNGLETFTKDLQANFTLGNM